MKCERLTLFLMPGHPMVRTASGTHVLQPSVNFGDQPGVENLSTRCLSLRIVRGKNSILQRAALQVVRGETSQKNCWLASSILRYSYNHCNAQSRRTEKMKPFKVY